MQSLFVSGWRGWIGVGAACVAGLSALGMGVGIPVVLHRPRGSALKKGLGEPLRQAAYTLVDRAVDRTADPLAKAVDEIVDKTVAGGFRNG